jgi:hypothetical protein
VVNNLINGCEWSDVNWGRAAISGVAAGATVVGLGAVANGWRAANAVRVAASAADDVPDTLVLARGGANTAERFSSGSGVVTNADGTLSGVSVNSGRTIQEAAQGIRHSKIGVTTAGEVRRAGGTVTRDPLPDNPGHCLLSGCTADTFSRLFTPTIKNPG